MMMIYENQHARADHINRSQKCHNTPTFSSANIVTASITDKRHQQLGDQPYFR